MAVNKFGRHKVTPSIASKWLKEFNYSDNRPISRFDVEYLARQMKAGHWKENGEPLIFDKEGHLIDGQHRLSAVALSGCTITFDVRRGIETDAFTTIDQGKRRTGAQVLAMRGVKNASVLAACARMVYHWETKGSIFIGRKVSPDELFIVVDSYPEALTEAVAVAVKLRPSKVPMEASMCAVAYFLLAQVSKKKADEFFEVLRDGVASSKNHPAITLRNRLFSESVASTHRRLPKRASWGLVIRAWNHHHANKTVTQLQVKADGKGGFKIPAIRGAGQGQCRKGGVRTKKNGTK